jgi:hypothetical protein
MSNIVFNLRFLCIFIVYITSTLEVSCDCFIGTYRSEIGPFTSCAGFRTCEVGFYCSNGIRSPCPGGTYGNSLGLQNATCSGLCPEGYYCPPLTSFPYQNPCGDSNLYCPKGSKSPIEIPTGYYGIGADVNKFSSIEECPKGHYCIRGIKHACPAGYYGEKTGLSTVTCSGSCPMGFYCPIATINPNDHPCGVSETSYCPDNSPKPVPTTPGYYADKQMVAAGGGFGMEVKCPPGTYCILGKKYLCPAGRYGSRSGGTNSSCEGLCSPGYFCPPGSANSKQLPCGNTSMYCPPGSARPIHVSLGHYSTGSNPEYDAKHQFGDNFDVSTRSAQAPCEPGYFCAADGKIL